MIEMDNQSQNPNTEESNILPLPLASLRGNTEEGLDQLRTRLLDLTLRNRLLNFRHTKRSSLRIIDKIPDQLYKGLVDGRTFSFMPVPEPTRHDLINYYQERGIPWNNQKPSVEEWAAHKGIRTDFDLPVTPSGGDDSPHTDNKIQTLLYPKDLEATLRTIASAARTAIEESGTNMLYLGLGFLEWKDRNATGSSKPLAPLVLLPVTVTVNRRIGTYKITYSGEDIAVNLSLQEKLTRDFGTELPDIEDDEFPEAYFRRIERKIEGQLEWCVRRFVTLSLFHFGKLLMYLDLDPLRWPAQNILDHPIVRSFFEGRDEEDSGPAKEYQLDDEPELTAQAPIIYDADSSQHSALIDAIQGRNLVIEGPPGTGKSQTITNLIAAALDQGKSILFVSEKLAALEVVRRRLDEAGLGDFCLELHSHKTQKKTLISDIRTRLEKKNSYLSPHQLDSQIEILEKDKEHLKQHAELIGNEFGEIGMTIQEILCSAARYRIAVGSLATLLSDWNLDDPDHFRPVDKAQSEGFLEAYQGTIGGILRQWQSPTAHPWHGVCNIELQPFDAARIEQLLRAWKKEGERLKEEFVKLQEMTGVEVDITGRTAQQFGQMDQSVPSPQGDEWLHALPQLSTPEKVVQLEQFSDQIKHYHAIEVQLEELLEDYHLVKGELRSDLDQAIAQMLDLSEDWISVLQLEEYREQLGRLSDLIQTIAPVIADLSRHLAIPIVLSEESIKQIQAAIRVCQQAPNHLLHLRDELFRNDEFDDVLSWVEAEILSLKKQEESLQDTYTLDLIPSSRPLRQAQRTMAAGGLSRWFKRDWREANRLLKTISIGKVRGAPGIKAQLLGSLAQYKEHQEKFEGDERAHRVLKHLYIGIDTDISGLRALREWYSAVQRELGYGLGLQGIPSEAVLGLSNSIVRAVAQLGEGPFNEHLDEIIRLLDQLGKAMPTLKRGRLDGPESVLTEIIGHLENVLRIFSNAGVKKEPILEQIAQIPALLQRLDNLENLAESDSFAQVALGTTFEGIGTDQGKLDEILLLARNVHECSIPQDFKLYLLNQGTASSFQDMKTNFSITAAVFAQMEQRRNEFTEFTQLDSMAWFGVRSDAVAIDQLLTRAGNTLSELGSLSQWTNYLRSRDQLKEKRLLDFADWVERGELPPNQLVPVYRYLIYNELARVILQKYPRLRRFNGQNQNVIRQRFIQCDEGIISLQQEKIASKIDRRSVPVGVDRGRADSRTELRLLEHETSLQRHKIKIRQLMERGGKALQALKPCFMMGPLSVAQYLAPGKLTFDLVVMDEASQVRPEDALGAVARGGQFVVVGDPRQLPPTRFFDRMFGDGAEEDDDNVLQAAESILDAAISIFRPTRRLLWHYRSRHESLIAFSNHHFYNDNPLIVFPSPHPEDPRYGVRFVEIGDGIFRNHMNVPEAKRIAQAVIKHMRINRGESLGVVAMNNPQSDLIAEEVDRLLKEDPQAQSYLESYSNHSEPFFVKNLENVQGDERDVIFISFTYGRSEPGSVVHQRFGPITHAVGWRRLNVLFTRAKNRIVAFSSMSSSDIRGGPDVSEGTRALKNYLAYAETGILEQARESGHPPDSDFEVAVADALQREGYECVAQVGVAGFFIDIAVMHPDLPGKYLLGVECDGATYHSARSVRDRDRLRQAVLENLGWTIHRIWSTDWFRDSPSEVRRVLDRLAELREEEIPLPVEIPVEEVPPTTETTEEVEVAHDEQMDIELQDAEEAPPSERFLTVEVARAKLIELREGTIRVEMPDSDLTEGFLRRSMLDALLRHRPKSKEEFSRRIALNLRERLDVEQFARYHEQVFEILAQIVSPQQQSLF